MRSIPFRAGLALAMTLGAVPALADEVSWTTKTPPPVTGVQVYSQVCQACHMADGRGGAGAATIPALANNPRLAAPAYPILLVVRGRGAMPGLTDLLGPAQIAAVATYVRSHFGNAYPAPVTADAVRPFLPVRR
jgi:mono/diheme cytochrome c family protein